MIRSQVVGALLALTVAAALPAQSRFVADADGGQVVPAQSHTEVGGGRFRVNSFGQLEYQVGATMSVVSAAIYDAAIGGPLRSKLFDLTKSGPNNFSGTTPQMNQQQYLTLLSGAGHVQVVGQNNVIVRGQIVIGPTYFGAVLNGSNVTPPTNSSATGQVEFDLLNGALTANICTLSRDDLLNVVDRTLFAPRFPNVPKLTLKDGKSVTVFSAFQQSALESEVLSAVYTTTQFPNGEIAGPVRPVGQVVGRPCPTGNLNPKLRVTGATARGGTLRVKITGGEPNGDGFVFIGKLDYEFNMVKIAGCPVYSFPDLGVLPLKLDANGAACIVLPDLPSIKEEVTVQFGGLSNGKLYTTNCVDILFDD